MTTADLDRFFGYCAPDNDQAKRHQYIRDGGKQFAELVLHLTPRGADQEAAVRKIREAVMVANAAIACCE